MKYLIVLILFISSCIVVDDDSCTYDYECFSETEACIFGQCEFIGGPSNYITTECNCRPTSAYPGDIYQNFICESGLEVVVECGSVCCEGYVCYPSWGTVCL